MIKKDYSSKIFYFWFAALMIIAAWIRIQGTMDYYYNPDESMHMNIASGSTLHDVLRFSLHETHPPILYILLHYWMKLSSSVVFVRCLPLLFGLAVIPVFYHIGKLLHSQLTGICCAGLIAFSFGCIIQSFVIRHYSVMLFFLSCAFYYYLRWQDKEENSALSLYSLFSVLACMTHFSAIFMVFLCFIYENVKLGRASPFKTKIYVKWILANALPGISFLCGYYIWSQSISETVRLEIAHFYDKPVYFNLLEMISIIPFWLERLFDYLVFNKYCFYIVILFLPLAIARKDKKLNGILILALSALACEFILFFTKIYPYVASRHSLWMVPLFIPAVGYIIANAIEKLNEYLAGYKLHLSLPFIMVAFLTLGLCCYNSQKRFDGIDEYFIKIKEWHDVKNHLATIKNDSIIFTVRDDAVLLANIYSFLDIKPSIKETFNTIVIPYDDTRIIFNASFLRVITKNIFFETLKFAERNHALDNVDYLVFMKTRWDIASNGINILSSLATCPQLKKEIIFFPSFPAQPFSYDEMEKKSSFTFLKISKKEFFEKIISPDGIARACLQKDPYEK